MGNTIGGKSKKAKIMKISGETLKVKTPIRVGDIVNKHPGHVLLNSEAVKHFGIRAKALEAQHELKPRSTYFLVELPKFESINSEEGGRSNSRLGIRVRSSANIQVSAKERLECLMLSRRSTSDFTSIVRSATPPSSREGKGAPVRMKIRLTMAQIVKLMEESTDEMEVANKIIQLYTANAGTVADNKNMDKIELHFQGTLGD